MIKAVRRFFAKRREKRMNELHSSLGLYLDDLVELNVDKERQIDNGVRPELVITPAYKEYERTLGEAIAATLRAMLGPDIRFEYATLIRTAVIRVEAEIGREITDKAEIMEGVRKIEAGGL